MPGGSAREQLAGQLVEAPLTSRKLYFIMRIELDEEGIDPVRRRITDHEFRLAMIGKHGKRWVKLLGTRRRRACGGEREKCDDCHLDLDHPFAGQPAEGSGRETPALRAFHVRPLVLRLWSKAIE